MLKRSSLTCHTATIVALAGAAIVCLQAQGQSTNKDVHRMSQLQCLVAWHMQPDIKKQKQ